jgi:G3E family GTPase
MSQASPLRLAPKVSLTIIAGFLGSGKTSLLNHLLTQSGGRKITALVNDFGALNIDSELIEAQHGNQVSLTNGCICCSIGDDLMRSLADIMRQDPLPDHLIIEASGVADPTRIAAYAAVDPQLRLDGIVTLVDAAAHALHAQDPYLADNYHKQIEAGHMLLLSKPDLVEDAQVEALEAALLASYPAKPQARVRHGHLPIEVVLGLRGDINLPPLGSQIKDHGLASWSAHLHGDIAREVLAEKIISLAPHVLRAKGILRDPQGAYAVHYAGGRIDFETLDITPSGHFVLIGKPELPPADTLSNLFQSTPA